MRFTWISRGWENVERHWSKDMVPMDCAYFSRNFRGQEVRMPIRPSDELGPALGQHDVLPAVCRVERQTDRRR